MGGRLSRPGQLLLDTCALLDLAAGHRFPPAVRAALDAARDERKALVSAVSALEIARKVWAGKLNLGDPPAVWLKDTLVRYGLGELPISSSIALEAYALPEPFHRDPADRLVVATARLLGLPVLTSDRHIAAYAATGHVDVLPY